MPDSIPCPDCGHANPPDRTTCEACNFPLTGRPEPMPEATPVASAAPPAAGAKGAPPAAAPPAARLLIPRPVRRPRSGPPVSSMSLTLWLFFGTVCVAALLWTAITGFNKSNAPVEGASGHQQALADSLYAVLAKDSANVEANLMLGDLLYDTGNWQEAIRHYETGIAGDSSRTTSIVDLGVCYFNLGNATAAERHFEIALARDPHQTVALFNLGVVAESRQEWDRALDYYHRTLESGPPDNMRQPLMDRMEQVFKKSGKKAPPLTGGK
jgi:Tetratricopeptide repeat